MGRPSAPLKPPHSHPPTCGPALTLGPSRRLEQSVTPQAHGAIVTEIKRAVSSASPGAPPPSWPEVVGRQVNLKSQGSRASTVGRLREGARLKSCRADSHCFWCSLGAAWISRVEPLKQRQQTSPCRLALGQLPTRWPAVSLVWPSGSERLLATLAPSASRRRAHAFWSPMSRRLWQEALVGEWRLHAATT